jgi:hypothetical protein
MDAEEQSLFNRLEEELKPQPWYVKAASFFLIVLTIIVFAVVVITLMALVAAGIVALMMLAVHVWEGLLR